MSLTFRLPNGEVGDYAWGSNVVRFTHWAQVTKDTAIRSMAGLAQGLSSWDSNAAFRAMIAFHHEIVHYLQDTLTGVGHWDFLVRQRYILKLNTLARKYSYDQTLTIPYKSDAARSMISEMRGQLVMLPTPKVPVTRRNRVANELRSLGAEHLNPEQPIEQALLIESILEGEAAATVAIQLIRLVKRMPKPQLAIANQNRSLWAPYYMDKRYGQTIWFFLSSLDTVFGAGHDKSLNGAYREIYYRLMVFFVDLGCAYPPPGLVEGSGLRPSDYEPGIRIARMFKTFLFLNDSETEQFMNALFRENDVVRAETLLLKRCALPYLSSSRIYQAWADLFAQMMKSDDDRLLLLRHDACRRRVDDPSVGIHKDLFTAVDKQIPIYFMTPRGLNSHHFSLEHLESEEFSMMVGDLMRHNRDLASMDFFFEDGRFVCPLAEARMCSTRIPECTSGLGTLNQLPSSLDCRVRDALADAGWHFPDER